MKKRKWIFTIVVFLLLICLIPIPVGPSKDGGTREYKALTYKIIVWNRLGDVDADTYHKTRLYLIPDNFRSVDELWLREADHVQHTFIATILEINGSVVVVQPEESSVLFYSSDKISFGTGDLEKIDAKVGSRVQVTYTGGIMESYPAQIRATSWKLITE